MAPETTTVAQQPNDHGALSSDVLSPVKEGETVPESVTPAVSKLAALNSELSKINSRRDSVDPVKEEVKTENVAGLNAAKDGGGDKKERKISR